MAHGKPHSRNERQYLETGPSLLAYFQRRRVSAADAEDLLHETFARVWRQPDRMGAAVSVRAYLFGVARHVWLDAHRRRHPTESMLVEPGELEERAVPDERIVLLRAAIAALPESQREALRLKLEDEFSYAEIAEALQIPIGTVRSRLHHAVLRLQSVLNPPASGEPPASNPNTHES